MECSEPGAIRDEELLAYLAGEPVRTVVVQHLAVCQRCSLQLTDYQRMELKLTSKLYRRDCPPSQILGEYQLGQLSNDLAAIVKFHLSMCVLCAAEVATLSQFLAGDPLVVEYTSAPRVAVHSSTLNSHGAAHEAKRALDSLREQATAGVRRVIATLLPPPQQRYAYQREPSQTVLWPRRYTAEDLSISIQVGRGTSRRDTLQLIGFVTRKGAALEALQGTPVLLSSQGSPVYTQNIDELGNFVFPSISAATYTLELQLPESIVVIEQLTVAPHD